GGVEVDESRTVEKVRAGIAVCILRGKRESVAVNAGDQHAAAARSMDRTYKIGPLAGRAGVGLIWRNRYVDRDAGLNGYDPAQGPSAESRAQQGVRRVGQEGNLPQVRPDEAVTDIRARIAVVGSPVIRIHDLAATEGIGALIQAVRPGIVQLH